MRFDPVAEMGVVDGSRFKLLLERRPKWLLLLLYLRKRVMLGVREAQRLLGVKYGCLRSAIRYLAGVPEPGQTPPPSTIHRPLVSVETLSPREKYIVLTEYGREFAEKATRLLKKIVLACGGVDVERELGVARVEVEERLRETLARHNLKPHRSLEDRIVDWERVVHSLTLTHPTLLKVLNTEVVDAVPFTVETPRGTRTLYVIL